MRSEARIHHGQPLSEPALRTADLDSTPLTLLSPPPSERPDDPEWPPSELFYFGSFVGTCFARAHAAEQEQGRCGRQWPN